MRRTAATIVAALGVVLIALPFALSLFGRASDAEKLSSAVRPSMTTQGLAGLQDDFDTAYAAGDQFIQKTIPAVAQALHLTSAQLAAYVGSNFPDVATGVTRWYVMSDDARNDIDIIKTHKTQFDAADAIPTASVPLTAGPYGFIALGVALLIAGAVAFRTGARGAFAASLILGIAAVAIPFALSFPHKASQTDQVMKSLRNVLSRQEVNTLQTNLGVVEKMVPQLTQKMIPALEQKLHMTPQQFQDFVATNFPAVAKGLASFRPILDRMSARVSVMDAGVPLYSQTAKIQFGALPWLFIVPGIVVALASAAALASGAKVTVDGT